MRDDIPSTETSLDNIDDRLIDIHSALVNGSPYLSDDAFEDECAMRAMNRLLASKVASQVRDNLDVAAFARGVAEASFTVAAAMSAERKRRRG